MRSKLFKGVTKQVVTDTLSMAWPSVLEFVFLQLISMIDSVMVAGLGKAAVAAIGLTNQAMFIRLIPTTAGNIALAAMVARRRGENNKEAANRILVTALTCDADAIDLNGHTLYVNGVAYEAGTTSSGSSIEFTLPTGGGMGGAPDGGPGGEPPAKPGE